MYINISNKVVLVTGSSRGIGRELIRAFSLEGAKVVINYHHSMEEANELRKEMVESNAECLLIKADVTKVDEVQLMINQVIAEYGRIDILINNAGVCEDNLLCQMTEEQWNTVININLTGVYLCCRFGAKIMMKQGYGKIINISSLKGEEGCEGQTNYSASKAGVIGFTKALAKELGKYNVSVNAICPGFIVTDLNRTNEAKKVKAITRSLLPIENCLYDLVNFILFLSSDKIMGVSGRVFYLDSRL